MRLRAGVEMEGRAVALASLALDRVEGLLDDLLAHGADPRGEGGLELHGGRQCPPHANRDRQPEVACDVA